MEIYLIRHTVPQIEKGICYGQSDISLAETFRVDTQNILNHLPVRVDAVYSSPLSRCVKLAELINSGQKFTHDKRLMEMNFGNWEMKKWDEINQEALNEWMQDFVNVRVPSGENFIDMNNRVNEFIDELLKGDFKKVALVTHAGVIRSVLCQILEIPLRNAFKIPIDYGSITKINIEKKSCYQSIEYINQTLKIETL